MRIIVSYFDELFEKRLAKLQGASATLPLLSEQQLLKVHARHLIADLESHLNHSKLGDIVAAEGWFWELNDAQRKQVIDYYRTFPFGRDENVILNWYDQEQVFRIERNHHLSPVTSR